MIWKFELWAYILIETPVILRYQLVSSLWSSEVSMIMIHIADVVLCKM